MRLLPYGPRAVLAEFETLDDVMTHAAAWRASSMPGVVDVVPAARTVLVVHDGSLDETKLRKAAGAPAAGPVREISLDVVYDGADLAEVAQRCGMSVDDVVQMHTGAAYTGAFCGFMPGFGYLVGLPAALHLPRRDTPRTRVPAGSVAIAAEFTGVYPRESPGGWHILGHTRATLWDDDADPPALLAPGTQVRFRAR